MSGKFKRVYLEAVTAGTPAKRELDETTIGAPKLVVDASPVRAGNACNWRP
jgi:hypothetical protein